MDSTLAHWSRALVRRRFVVLAAATTVAMLLDLGHPAADWELFLGAGRHLLSTDWLNTFSDPGVQAGPLFLAGLAAVDRLVSLVGIPLLPVLSALTYSSTVLGFLAVHRRIARTEGRAPSPVVELVGPLLVLLWSLTSDAFLAGHPAQLWIPLLWVLAGLHARKGKWHLAGLLVAAAAGIETSGTLGIALLALSPDMGRVVRSASVAAAATAAQFLPFLVFGTFSMGHYIWPVSADAPIALLLGAQTFTWPLRFLQAITSVALTAAVARVARRVDLSVAVWGIPLLLVLTRLTVDPLIYDYYWVAAQVLAIGLATGLLGSRRLSYLVPGLVCYLVFLVDAITPAGTLLLAVPALAGFLFMNSRTASTYDLSLRATAEASEGRT